MATTVPMAFDEFNTAIMPSTALKGKVGERRSAVVKVLKNAFPSTASIQFQSDWLVGSLGRNTASLPVDDLDLMVHLHVDDDLWRRSYATDSSEFLYRVRRSLNDASTVKKIGARGQAVRLFYGDGLTVDVAAVVKYTGGGYGIPNGTGGWLTTNPIKHADYLNETNSKLVGDLKKFVRVVKQWNKAHSSRLSSFHLEMLAARTFASLNNNTRDALKVFFEYNRYNLSVQDPAGYGGDLASYLTPNASTAVGVSMQAALDRATSALTAEHNGNHAEAVRLWKIILGDKFPIYG